MLTLLGAKRTKRCSLFFHVPFLLRRCDASLEKASPSADFCSLSPFGFSKSRRKIEREAAHGAREREREREEEEEEESDGQMVKAYLRYEHRLCFGVVASTSSGAKIVEGSGSVLSGGNWSQEKTVLTPALEAVNLWHLRKGVLIKRLVPTDSSSSSATASLGGAGGGGEKPIGIVTSLCRIQNSHDVAVGYSSGTVKVWNLRGGECEKSFAGHKTAVSSLQYSKEKKVLASGGR